MNPFVTFESTALLLPLDDIDTDQIIPARYLKGTDKKGLAERLFADWRTRPDFPLLARTRAVGAARLRLSRRDQHRDCGHLSLQLTEERPAAGRRR